MQLKKRYLSREDLPSKYYNKKFTLEIIYKDQIFIDSLAFISLGG